MDAAMVPKNTPLFLNVLTEIIPAYKFTRFVKNPNTKQTQKPIIWFHGMLHAYNIDTSVYNLYYALYFIYSLPYQVILKLYQWNSNGNTLHKEHYI